MLPLPCRDGSVTRSPWSPWRPRCCSPPEDSAPKLAKHGTSHSSPISQVAKYPIQISHSSQHVTAHSGMFRNKARFHCTPLMSWGFQHVTRGTHIFICFQIFQTFQKVHVTFWRHSGGDRSWPSTPALGGQEESLRRPSLAAQALGFSLICRKHQTSSDFWHFDDTVITFVKLITS